MTKKAQGTNDRDTAKPLDADSSIANDIPYEIWHHQTLYLTLIYFYLNWVTSIYNTEAIQKLF